MAADGDRAEGVVDFQTEPSRYRHWKLAVDGEVATLSLDVDENGGLFPGYALKLNSYDLGVDIELADAVQRLRFEHPAVKVVVMRSAKDRVFCAGANIRMLAGASHGHKVNFCKFTNETRNAIEDASAFADQKFICVITGTAAGGGYELALAADHIMLVDDGSSSVALPEVPLLAVLPGTGGLTRVTDKRKVRRDHADVFCTIEEGIKGRRAVEWRLVDEILPRSRVEEKIAARVDDFRARSPRPEGLKGIALTPLRREIGPDRLRYSAVAVEIDRAAPRHDGDRARPRRAAAGRRRRPRRRGRRELDAARRPRARRRHPASAPQRARDRGDPAQDARATRRSPPRTTASSTSQPGPLARARDPPSLEARAEARRPHLALARRADRAGLAALPARWPSSSSPADRSYMLIGRFEGDNRPAATLTLGAANFGPCPMVQRADPARDALPRRAGGVEAAKAAIGQRARGGGGRSARASSPSRSTTSTGRTRCASSSRSARASRRMGSPAWKRTCASPGPRRWRSKIFARLTAWQNWIFQRPNAVGAGRAPLRRYGTGQKAAFDMGRV